MATNTVKRNWLLKQIEAGKVEAKCTHYMTDDYAFDNANKFGATGWMPARIKHPTFRTVMMQGGWEREIVDDPDFIEGRMNFNTSDFEGKSGGAYRQNDGTISFYIHSNAHYTLRMVEAA